MKNKSIYLTKSEKLLILGLMEAQLKRQKTNQYYGFIKKEYERIKNKIN